MFILLRSNLKIAAVNIERKNIPLKKITSFILLRKNESIGRFEILNDMAKAIIAVRRCR